MLVAGYFHPFSSRVVRRQLLILITIGRAKGLQLTPVTGQNSIKNGSFLREQKFLLQRLLLE
jgi:hypothetical protein